MRLCFLMVGLAACLSSVTGCTKVSEEELQVKVDKCSSAGMNYTYMRDFKGDPYDVMCVPKRLR